MYKIQSDINLDAIINNSISEFCLYRHGVNFKIGETAFMVQSAMVEQKLELIIGRWWTNQNFDKEFFDILDCKVISYQVDDKETLRILFENDYSLLILDNSDQFESFQILVPGKDIIVI